jgi:hypothetical protein
MRPANGSSTLRSILGVSLLLSAFVGSDVLSDTRRGDFATPMTIHQFVVSPSDAVVRLRVRASLVTADTSGACVYAHEVTIDRWIRGDEHGEVIVCADYALNSGGSYLAFLFDETRLPSSQADNIRMMLGLRGGDRPIFFLKPNWQYRMYSLVQSPGVVLDYVVIPEAHVTPPVACITRTERQTVEVSDDDTVHETKYNHVSWDCFVREANEPDL